MVVDSYFIKDKASEFVESEYLQSLYNEEERELLHDGFYAGYMKAWEDFQNGETTIMGLNINEIRKLKAEKKCL